MQQSLRLTRLATGAGATSTTVRRNITMCTPARVLVLGVLVWCEYVNKYSMGNSKHIILINYKIEWPKILVHDLRV